MHIAASIALALLLGVSSNMAALLIMSELRDSTRKWTRGRAALAQLAVMVTTLAVSIGVAVLAVRYSSGGSDWSV